MKTDINEWLKYKYGKEKLYESEKEFLKKINISPKDFSESKEYSENVPSENGGLQSSILTLPNVSFRFNNNDKGDENLIINIIESNGLYSYDRFKNVINYYDRESLDAVKDIDSKYNILKSYYEDLLDRFGLVPDKTKEFDRVKSYKDILIEEKSKVL